MALTDTLVALWELNEASGNRADSIGSSTLADNNTVSSESGKFSQNAALIVSANSEYLSVSDNAALSMGDIDFSIAAWIKINSDPGTEQGLVTKWNHSAEQREYRIGFRYAGGSAKFYFNISDSGGGGSQRVSADTLGVITADGSTWYWVYVYHDAANNLIGISGNNGTIDTESHSTGVYDGTSDFVLGRLASGIQQADCSIQQVAIWKRLLTSDERITIYNSGTGLAFSGWVTGNRRRRVLIGAGA